MINLVAARIAPSALRYVETATYSANLLRRKADAGQVNWQGCLISSLPGACLCRFTFFRRKSLYCDSGGDFYPFYKVKRRLKEMFIKYSLIVSVS